MPRVNGPGKRRAEQVSETQSTILDWYQGLTRLIWTKIGINPRYVHGLDELTALVSFSSYFITFFFTLLAAPQRSELRAPTYSDNTSAMLCRTPRYVGAAYTYQYDSITFTGHSDVSFVAIPGFDGASSSFDVLLALPRQTYPFSQDGYAAIVGAINHMLCQQDDKVTFSTPLRVLFGLGETTDQIRDAAREISPHISTVIAINSRRGHNRLVGTTANHLSRAFSGSLPIEQFSDVYDAVSRLTTKHTGKMGSPQMDESQLIVDFHAFSGYDGDRLNLGSVYVEQSMEAQRRVDSAAASQMFHDLSEIMSSVDRLMHNNTASNEASTHDHQHLSEHQRHVQRATLFFGKTVAVRHGIMYLIAYAITMPLAIDINVFHRKQRVSFVKGIFRSLGVRVLTSAAAIFLIYCSTYILAAIMHTTPQLYVTDSDFFFKACGLAVGLSGTLVFQLESQQLIFQKSIACQLLCLYGSILLRMQCSLFLAQIVLFSYVGLYITEFFQWKSWIQRPWAVNAVFIITATMPQIGFAVSQLFLSQQCQDATRPVLAVVVLNCVVFTLIFGWYGQLIKLCTGRLIVIGGTAAAVLFYLKLSFTNNVEQLILQNTAAKVSEKTSSIPSTVGVNNVMLFCRPTVQLCDLVVPSGRVQQVKMEDGAVSMFRGKVRITISADSKAKRYSREGGLVSETPHGSYRAAVASVSNAVWWRYNVKAYVSDE